MRFPVLPRPTARTLLGLLAAGLAGAALVSALESPASAAGPRIRLTRVGTGVSPVGVVARPGDPQAYVVEQGGLIRPLSKDGSAAPVLDVRADVSAGGERGLLGLAFSPDGGKLYVDLTNRAGDTEIREYTWAGGKADPASKRLLLTVDQPYANHNGGALQVSADGVLWIGMGDGGAAGDPEGRAQRTDTLLGKILRIDPRPDGDRPYRIPAGNAFAAGGGRPEIWAIGVRNPWRFTLDVPAGGASAAGTVWIGDVGQDTWEEVDAVPMTKTGANLGWDRREGRHEYEGGRPAGNVEPVYEYKHSGGACSITGGFVYRGRKIPALVGRYVFGDYCDGKLRTLTRDESAWRADVLGVKVAQLTSFGVDAAGELYATSGQGPIYRLDPR